MSLYVPLVYGISIAIFRLPNDVFSKNSLLKSRSRWSLERERTKSVFYYLLRWKRFPSKFGVAVHWISAITERTLWSGWSLWIAACCERERRNAAYNYLQLSNSDLGLVRLQLISYFRSLHYQCRLRLTWRRDFPSDITRDTAVQEKDHSGDHEEDTPRFTLPVCWRIMTPIKWRSIRSDKDLAVLPMQWTKRDLSICPHLLWKSSASIRDRVLRGDSSTFEFPILCRTRLSTWTQVWVICNQRFHAVTNLFHYNCHCFRTWYMFPNRVGYLHWANKHWGFCYGSEMSTDDSLRGTTALSSRSAT